MDAKRGKYDASHLDPNWEIGDKLKLFNRNGDGYVEKTITITQIEVTPD
jgi:hypothetical protein